MPYKDPVKARECGRRCKARARAAGRQLPLRELDTTQRSAYGGFRSWRIKWRWVLAKGGKCARCGMLATARNLECFDFDHVDPTAKACEITKVLSTGDDALIAPEMSKCQLLCANCHRTKTRNDSAKNDTAWLSGLSDGSLISIAYLSPRTVRASCNPDDAFVETIRMFAIFRRVTDDCVVVERTEDGLAGSGSCFAIPKFLLRSAKLVRRKKRCAYTYDKPRKKKDHGTEQSKPVA